MKIFWIVLIVTYLLNMFAEKHPSLVYVTGKDGRKERVYKPNKYIYGIVTIIMILVSGLRSGVGDTGTYRDIFSRIPSSVFQFLQSPTIKEDQGFYIIVAFIKQFISDDTQVAIFIFAFITIGLICYSLYKYTDETKMAIFLFITMGCFSTSMNGMRQYVAASIVFCALPLMQKRKLIPYIIVIYLASTMHASAMIFLPLYFLNRCKGWGTISYVFIGIGALLYLTYNITGPIIADVLGETQYGHYADELLSNDQGANMLRVAVSFVPVAFSWLGKNNINQNMKYGNVIVNLNILNFIVMLLATKHWIYARFCIYFNLYALVLLTFCINNIFEKSSSKIIKVLCMVLYIVFYWYDSLMQGLTYRSNYFNFW